MPARPAAPGRGSGQGGEGPGWEQVVLGQVRSCCPAPPLMGSLLVVAQAWPAAPTPCCPWSVPSDARSRPPAAPPLNFGLGDRCRCPSVCRAQC